MNAASTFSDLGLAEPILRAVTEQGYTQPTPIQAQAIPVVLAGRDMMGGAQTGTGKTAGFTLPILHKLLPHANTSVSPARHQIRALILAPTRELAAQVEESVRTYAKHTGLRATVIYGGISIDPQIAELRRGVEILVATPGRLLDHAQQKSVNLSQVEVFVLDEADRMLDMGFIPDVKRIIALLPPKRQNLLFSATLPEDIKRLADSFLHDPVQIQVARRNAAAESVTHMVHPVARERKRELLIHLVKTREMKQVLVFTATRLGCNRLAYQLNRDGVHAAAIHGDKSQGERTEALEAFKAGKVRVLVATDVAARGLDIEDLPSVVNFDLPNSAEDYVHRIGRTGRAGASGEAISLVAPEEQERLTEIEQMIKTRIKREIIPGFGPEARAAAAIMDEPRRERRPAAKQRDRLTESPSAQASRSSRASHPSHASHNATRRPPADPIFTQPYQSLAEPSPSKGEKGGLPASTTQRPQRQVAALLGGLNLKRN